MVSSYVTPNALLDASATPASHSGNAQISWHWGQRADPILTLSLPPWRRPRRRAAKFQLSQARETMLFAALLQHYSSLWPADSPAWAHALWIPQSVFLLFFPPWSRIFPAALFWKSQTLETILVSSSKRTKQSTWHLWSGTTKQQWKCVNDSCGNHLAQPEKHHVTWRKHVFRRSHVVWAKAKLNSI
jgi:hypothetical protein